MYITDLEHIQSKHFNKLLTQVSLTMNFPLGTCQKQLKVAKKTETRKSEKPLSTWINYELNSFKCVQKTFANFLARV